MNKKLLWIILPFAIGIIIMIVLLCTLLPTNTTNNNPVNPVNPDNPTSNFLQITNNTTQNPLSISLQIDNTQDIWTKLSGSGTLGSPVLNDETKNPPNYQLVSLGLNETIYIQMRTTGPWRVTPLKTNDPSNPILVECGKDIVCDMSAVDGINYHLNMILSTPNGSSTINQIGNPCSNQDGLGCNNPSVDGDFKIGTAWNDQEPCFAGTCNLENESKEYCDAIHLEQCSNSTQTWSFGSRSPDCEANNLFTTYCYSHDDTNSSPVLSSPYTLQLTFTDL